MDMYLLMLYTAYKEFIMDIWNSVYSFFSENVIVLSIVLVLTVTVTVLEKTKTIVKLFTAIKEKISAKKEAKKKQAEQMENISNSIQQINVKIDELSTELKSEIDSVRSELIAYIEEDGIRHNEILDAIKQLEQGNAYCLGEMIRRIYIENESTK